MQRIRFLVLLLLLCATPLLRAQNGTVGRSFVMTMPYLSPTATTLPIAVRLLITTTAATDIKLTYNATGQSEGFSMAANSSVEKLLDTLEILLPQSEATFRRTLTVTSTAPVRVALVMDRANSVEAYGAIPDSLLGTEYFAITGKGSDNGSVITVVGIADKTEVTITPTKKTATGHLPGQPYSVTLDRGDVYQILSESIIDADLSGTYILATRPCGVISGAPCENIIAGSDHACNPLLEQVPPVSAWGKEYVLAPLWKQQAGLYRIVGSCNGTRVSVNNATLNLNRGEMQEIPVEGAWVLTATAPVMVAQLVTSTSTGPADKNTAFGDPSMVIAPPTWQWGASVHFRDPDLSPRAADIQSLPVAWKHMAQIALPSSAESALKIDGSSPAWMTHSVVGGWSIGTVLISAGEHTASAPSPFSLLAYGYSAADAYAFAPDNVQKLSPLAVDSIARYICAGSYDTTLVVRNIGTEDVAVDSISFVGGLDAAVTAPPAFPVTIPAGSSISVTLHFPSISPSRSHGMMIISGGDCGNRLLAVPVDIYTDLLELIPPAGGIIDFGGVPPTVPSVDSVIGIYNAGDGPLTVNAPQLSSPLFTVISPTFPVVLPPKGAARVVIRFRPVDDQPVTGTASFTTGNCLIPIGITLKGIRRSGAFIDANPPLQLRLLCTPKDRDTIHFHVDNRGDLPLTVSDARLVGAAAGEFTLLTDLTAQPIPAESTREALVVYTPSVIGVRPVALQVVSNAVNRDTIRIPADVRNDSLAIIADLAVLDFDTTARCNPSPIVTLTLVNTGTVDLLPLQALLGRKGEYALLPDEFSVLDHGDTLRLRFQLSPAVADAFADTLHLRNSLCQTDIAIPIRGYRGESGLAFDRDTLDFGTIPWCPDDSTVEVWLRNNGVIADTAALRGLPSSPFLAAELPPFPMPIQPGDSVRVRVRLHGGSGGEIVDSLQVLGRACTRPMSLIIRGAFDANRPDFSLPVADFGTVSPGATVRKSLWVRNWTTVPVAFDPAKLLGVPSGVAVLSPSGPFVVGAGDSMEVVLEYAPTLSGESISGMLRVMASAPCDAALSAVVRGGSAIDERRMLLRWEDAEARAGEIVPLRLVLRQEKMPGDPDSVLLRTTLDMDASLLLEREIHSLIPDVSVRVVGITPSFGGRRKVEMEIWGVLPARGEIVEASALALLGRAPSSQLIVGPSLVIAAGSPDSLALADSITGTFRLLDLCESGGTRLVRIEGALRLALLGSNPVRGSGAVEVELVEQGRTRLSLASPMGEIVGRLIDAPLSPGIYRAVLDGSALPSGLYWLILETPTATERRSVVILR